MGFRGDIDAVWAFPETTHSEESLNYSKFATKEYWSRHKIRLKKSPARMDSFLFEPEKKPLLTVRDALDGLPDPQKTNSISNHILQTGAKIYPGHTGSFLDEPSKTIKAGTHGVPGGENMMVLDDGSVRYYTVREAARIQTFPDDYVFPCSWTESMRQIGNAVPVRLARIVSSSVKNALLPFAG